MNHIKRDTPAFRPISCSLRTTNIEYTGSLGFNSVCYLSSRTGWVSLKGIYRHRCTRNPGTDQPPPSNRPSGHKYI